MILWKANFCIKHHDLPVHENNQALVNFSSLILPTHSSHLFEGISIYERSRDIHFWIDDISEIIEPIEDTFLLIFRESSDLWSDSLYGDVIEKNMKSGTRSLISCEVGSCLRNREDFTVNSSHCISYFS